MNFTFYSQTIATYNGNTDKLFSTSTNWNNLEIPTSANYITDNNSINYLDVDIDVTVNRFETNVNRTGHFTLSHLSGSPIGTSTASASVLSIDLNNISSWPTDPNSWGIRHQVTASGKNLRIDGKLEFDNSSGGYTTIYNGGDDTNKIIFRSTSIINLTNGHSGTYSKDNSSIRIFNFNGEIKGSNNFVITSGVTTFGSTSNNPLHTGNLVLGADSNVNIDTDTDIGNIFKSSGNINVLGTSPATLTLNTSNAINSTVSLSLKNDQTLTLNLNEDQTIGPFDFTGTEMGTFNLVMAANKSIQFADSSAKSWGSGVINITGSFIEGGSVRFGSDGSGITTTQLALITVNGSAVRIDSNGWLRYAITLSIENEIINFSLFPNPVKEGRFVIKTSNNDPKKVQIYSLLGQEVYQNYVKSNELIDVSHLNQSFYLVRVEENGKIATRKLIVE